VRPRLHKDYRGTFDDLATSFAAIKESNSVAPASPPL
jgi:hypothetical protein